VRNDPGTGDERGGMEQKGGMRYPRAEPSPLTK